jgi:hypothetical protein
MEGYVLDGLKASADEVLCGLGDVVVQLAELVVRGLGTATLAGIEDGFAAGGKELLRSGVQLVLDKQAEAEQRLPAVTGADGIPRTCAERGHGRPVITEFGAVMIRRIGYRTREKGQPNLYVRDAVLNLPPGRYSWRLQELVVRFAREVAYDTVRELVQAATGITIGKRQIEEIVAAAAASVPGFYAGPGAAGPGQPGGEHEHQEGAAQLPLMLSADGKGVAMRPESRRKRAKAPGKRVKTFQNRAGIGEKGSKRIAQVACVFDVIPQPRTPEAVMAGHHGGAGHDPGTGQPGKAGRQRKPAPDAVSRRYRVDIAADRTQTTRWLFDEGERRDPGHDRDWGVLVDGDNHQIALIEAEAARRGITVTILIDLIHVLELSTGPDPPSSMSSTILKFTLCHRC